MITILSCKQYVYLQKIETGQAISLIQSLFSPWWEGGVTIVPRPPPLSSLYVWYHFDPWNVLIKNHYVLLCITPLTHTILPLLYPAFNISLFSFFFLLSPLPPSPPPCPANADLGLHTNIFPTIVEHEFISITKDCICIFNVLFFFLFADPPVWPPRGSLFRRLPPPFHVRGTCGSEGEEYFPT